MEKLVDDATLEIWSRLVGRVAKQEPYQGIQGVVSVLEPVGVSGDCLIVRSRADTGSFELRDRAVPLLEAMLRTESSGRFGRLIVQEASLGQQQELFPNFREERPSAPDRRAFPHNLTLLPKYTFANFVVGASNQFAHAAAKAVAQQPGYQYNPLFIYGGVGLGKTHLANAIGHEILERNAAARILYLSSESFMNELISALRRDRMDDFKSRFREVDVLILDDAQFLAGRERTQEEFFHTFNSLYEGHRQIVLTSDKFPKEIPDLEERLRNRFEWGLIADIQPPDMETRVAILEKKAEVERLDLPYEVAMFLASNITSNVRELEGSLTRLGAFASLNKCPITVDFAREVLEGVLREKKEQVITIDAIQRAVCDFFHVRPNDLRSKKRSRAVAGPRQVAMYLCRHYTDASFPVIGDRFGGRDHSTAIHAAQVVERKIKQDPSFRETVERIQQLIERSQ